MNDPQETPDTRDPTFEAEKMKLARQQVQKKHDEMASRYRKNVIEPREEERRRRQDADLQRATGFQGPGQRLGRIKLPVEPETGAHGCITVSLKDPEGQPHQRRFLHESTVQVLLDFMTLLGFSQSEFTLATSYPRQLLHDKKDSTLSDLGFTSRVSLNIEPREDTD